MRICRVCKKKKPLSEFPEPKRPTESITWCLDCKRTYWRERRAAQRASMTPEQKDIERLRKIGRNWGLTTPEIKTIWEAQGKRCAICRKKCKPSFDHCHKTGKPRALLCAKCNSGLGFFNDDIKVMKKAIEYLKKHQAG